MYEFMDYIQQAFHDTTQWNRDNSYSTLLSTSQALLDFRTPRGLCLHVSSLASPNYGNSYTLSNTGVVDGSLAYLYTSLPLHIASASAETPLSSLIRGYRHLTAPSRPDEAWWWEVWERGRRVDRRDMLMFGRLSLPYGSLEAMILRRTSPTTLLSVKAVSDRGLPNGGTILALLAKNMGKYSVEYLYSTDSALLGVRGLYNFGPDPRHEPHAQYQTPKSQPATAEATLFDALTAEIKPSSPSILSVGGEIYYGALSKSFGISTAARFTTLPAHNGFPYTMTLTLNPLMGNLSSTYSVKAGQNLALSSKFDFNFYSYESGVMLGCELWRRRRRPPTFEAGDIDEDSAAQETSSGIHVENRQGKDVVADQLDGGSSSTSSIKPPVLPTKVDEDIAGVLKARVDQNWRFSLLWEGRFKELLYSVGASVDLQKREQIFRGIGVEVSYSS